MRTRRRGRDRGCASRSPDLPDARLDAARPVRHRTVPAAALRDRRPTRLPIIMLTARGEESERVRGLATGADDYVVKPFSIPELMARVKAMLRRAKPEADRGGAEGRRHRTRPRDPSRPPRRPRDPSRADRVPAARVLDADPGPGVLARAAARRRLGPRHLCRRAHRGRACRAASQGDQSAAASAIRSARCAAPATPSTSSSRKWAPPERAWPGGIGPSAGQPIRPDVRTAAASGGGDRAAALATPVDAGW